MMLWRRSWPLYVLVMKDKSRFIVILTHFLNCILSSGIRLMSWGSPTGSGQETIMNLIEASQEFLSTVFEQEKALREQEAKLDTVGEPSEDSNKDTSQTVENDPLMSLHSSKMIRRDLFSGLEEKSG
ncbi:hypothetical protein PIB30_018346 [Stylosanthes scabra]|uniref:Uncharacterized protein n=1 Tax=Stylosanthes scabra TaxID=79078 RepID=A0ABU6Q7R3_9FABA|nr:hypothetical protein [Stylosanthes scabra]